MYFTEHVTIWPFCERNWNFKQIWAFNNRDWCLTFWFWHCLERSFVLEPILNKFLWPYGYISLSLERYNHWKYFGKIYNKNEQRTTARHRPCLKRNILIYELLTQDKILCVVLCPSDGTYNHLTCFGENGAASHSTFCSTSWFVRFEPQNNRVNELFGSISLCWKYSSYMQYLAIERRPQVKLDVTILKSWIINDQ